MLDVGFVSYHNPMIQGESFKTIMKYEYQEIGHAKIFLTNGGWIISEWFVDTKFQHQGLGRQMILYTLQQIMLVGHNKKPEHITYIWNGVNEYVHDFLVNNFDAKCRCPVKDLKENEKDNWLCHEYDLNVKKFLDYFNHVSFNIELR